MGGCSISLPGVGTPYCEASLHLTNEPYWAHFVFGDDMTELNVYLRSSGSDNACNHESAISLLQTSNDKLPHNMASKQTEHLPISLVIFCGDCH